MSVTVLSRVFWTEFQDLKYQQGQKSVTVSKPVAKLVMLAIADNADDFGENSWQSFETLSTKASIERRSVIRVVKALMASQYISINGKSRYGTNDYKINLSLLGHAPTARDKVGRPKTSDSPATNLQKTSDSETKTSDQQSPESSFNRPLTTTTTTTAEEKNEKASRIYSHFQNNMTMLTPILADMLDAAMEKYEEQWIIDAINESVKNSVRRWAYTESILERWATDGRDAKPQKETYGKNRNTRKPAEKTVVDPNKRELTPEDIETRKEIRRLRAAAGV
jgi:DnaD/phage-associated family protein